MIDRVLLNISNIDKIGLVILVLAGFITYGAKFLTERIFKIQGDRKFRMITILKSVGLLVGIFGFLKITKII